MNKEFKENGKGHDVFLNGVWIMWTIGSKKNAEKELNNYLKNK
ncbi:hypothetical protein M1M24_gp40 [Polaribacter phage Freya_1]|uniref:Uncharacterized protein n=2 Tax=Freyavirus TaxID=2948713 RepID=A0A8E5EB87_9CAUD|nr:hypothetical protein M1M23_gp25 [Polaribacter phage Danklef_1]YP_010356729.1 hypothetical protein M1M24_gp40 [Polaribacter phage Freya_1]QQV90582.1 hypothetical protein Danklef2_26 [Polaribacter phage Danklef_2]QQV90659.1 hypothetical protein Danklef3_27 [Polaribacter phage Danklef_3]QQV90735.1 hypothetical protein Danklef4_26 [Polaribacter phage Danklef_4]QQV90813.1 hypothetical protein Danklef5_27 [Polaribacter phage Danklef_5]QQV90977.1 hypothetical protein Freya2_40 [Polaribacter phage